MKVGNRWRRFVQGLDLQIPPCLHLHYSGMFGNQSGAIRGSSWITNWRKIGAGFTNLIVEVDSSKVLTFLSSKSDQAHANHQVIGSCRSLLQKTDWAVQLKKVDWSLHWLNSFAEHSTPPDCIRYELLVNTTM